MAAESNARTPAGAGILATARVVPFGVPTDDPGPVAPGARAEPTMNGGEAAADEASGAELDGSGREVHLHFPVEIEVRAASVAGDVDHIVALALRRLTEGLEST
jgi:hypothetical protein